MIKKLVIQYALFLKPKRELRIRIQGIVEEVAKKIPSDLKDKELYLKSITQTAEKLIRKYYDPIVRTATFMALMLLHSGITRKKLEKPVEVAKMLETLKPRQIETVNNYIKTQKRDLKLETKATPNVDSYIQNLKKSLEGISRTEMRASEPGKNPISNWQRAELDLRHEKQLDMINELKESGVRYAWTSSHPDCSKRCEPWQGKLFDLKAEHSELSHFRMKEKLDGHTVYCFKEVTSQKDKYGYENNIIVGFNCRHRLIPYSGHEYPPEAYDKKEVELEREINAKLREYETRIRKLKRDAILYKDTDKMLSLKCSKEAKRLTAEYKAFAEKHGFAWYQYRLEV